MWRRWWEKLDVDYQQWRILVRTALKLDFRSTGFGGAAYDNQGGGAGLGKFIAPLILYLVMGSVFALLAAVIEDVFLSGILVLTFVMFIVGTTLLLDYQSVITSPDDYLILAFQPISSRTYFAARLTSVIVYTVLMTTAFGLPSMLIYTFVARGFKPLLGISAVLAIYATSIATALAIIVSYASIVRLVPAYRLKRALSYLQVVMSFLVYGGFAIIGPLFDDPSIRQTLQRTPWLFVHPASWFASYLDLATGRTGIAQVGASVLSVAVMGGLLRSAAGRLSLDYAERLGALAAVSAPVEAASGGRRHGFWFNRDEPRAVALLVRAQFKHDQKFRLGVLGIVPLTIFYLYLGVRQGAILDPFVTSPDMAQDAIVYLAILLFPTIIQVSLTRSDAYRASWIFYACPAKISRLVLSMKWFVMASFVLPFLVMMAAIFLFRFGNAFHVAVHILVLGLLSHAFLQMAIFIDPSLPFSKPTLKGERSVVMLTMALVQAALSVPVVMLLSRFIYPSALRTVSFIATLSLVSAAVEQLLLLRVRSRSATWEYLG
jgi:hypothetical protein